MSKKKKRHRFRMDGFRERQQATVAFANSGYAVWVEPEGKGCGWYIRDIAVGKE